VYVAAQYSADNTLHISSCAPKTVNRCHQRPSKPSPSAAIALSTSPTWRDDAVCNTAHCLPAFTSFSSTSTARHALHAVSCNLLGHSFKLRLRATATAFASGLWFLTTLTHVPCCSQTLSLAPYSQTHPSLLQYIGLPSIPRNIMHPVGLLRSANTRIYYTAVLSYKPLLLAHLRWSPPPPVHQIPLPTLSTLRHPITVSRPQFSSATANYPCPGRTLRALACLEML
jgi:hypothetical protein